MSSEIGIWTVSSGQPLKMNRHKISLEQELEEWIVADPSLLTESVTIVGRQVHVEGGYIDLLAVDALDRLVVIELKRASLRRDVVAQVLDYASCLRALDGTQLRDLLEPSAQKLPDPESAIEAIDRLTKADDPDIALVVAGSGVDSGAERIVDMLRAFDLEIRIVSFDVFDREGELFMVREVFDERVGKETVKSEAGRKATMESLIAKADELGSGVEFRKVLELTEAAGLYNRAYTRGVMVAPPTHHNRYLMYLRPEKDRLLIHHGAEKFVEFFPDLDAQEIDRELGPSDEDVFVAIGDPDSHLEKIERVLGLID